MASALKIRPTSLPLPALPVPVDPLSLLPDFARTEAERCLSIIRPALIRVQQGVSVRAAALWLSSSATGMPSAPTIQRWLKDYLTGGIVDLAPKYKGRQRLDRGWEARALELYNAPQQRAYATVALLLRAEGHGRDVKAKAFSKQVERYLKASPSNLTETGKKRLGAHYYNQNIRPHKVRDNTVLPVGFVYQGDGHCCDVYVAHPATGRPFRPELTPWIDVRSQYVVSWWISESESAHTTLFSLSQALVAHNHVPAYVHTDPGSGFKAKLISDQVVGFLARFSVQPMLALPGNAKGKGLVEGWFRWFEERCGKNFETYCGHVRTDDFLRHLTEKVKRGQIVLPTLQQFIDAVRAYIDAYNNTPKDSLGGLTPAQLWAQLERVELHTPAEAIIRPRVQRTVTRWGVKLDKRVYRASALQQFEGRDVIVEYSIHSDDRVWVQDMKGRFIAEAKLVEKIAWLPSSRIEEAQQKRLEGQRQRHLAAIEEQSARARMPLSAANVMQALEADERPHLEPAGPAALAAGHSIHVGTGAPAPLQARHTAVDEDELELVRAAIRDDQVDETPEHRFMRWLQLRERSESGGDLSADDQRWLATYTDSAEWMGLADIYESFGYLPGAPSPQALLAQES